MRSVSAVALFALAGLMFYSSNQDELDQQLPGAQTTTDEARDATEDQSLDTDTRSSQADNTSISSPPVLPRVDLNNGEPAVESDQPVLVFEENFDVRRPNRWAAEYSTFGDGNNELQCYSPSLVTVRNGMLDLRAQRKRTLCPDGDVRSVASGMVRSSGFTFEPGQRVEFRARVLVSDISDMGGLWPALWAAGWNGGRWPAGGEVDLVEWISRESSRSAYSAHWQGPDSKPQRWSAASSHNLANQWHTYAFEWTTTELRWFADGNLVAKVDPSTFTALGTNPFTNPEAKITEFRINLALGGKWAGPLGTTAVDQAGTTHYQIDYLHIFDLPG